MMLTSLSLHIPDVKITYCSKLTETNASVSHDEGLVKFVLELLLVIEAFDGAKHNAIYLLKVPTLH